MAILERLGALTDEALAGLELEQDPLFHKIPEEKLPYYVQASLKRGREAASDCRGEDIRSLCKREGLRYEVTEQSGTFHNVSFRAQIDFAGTPPEIMIYSASLKSMQQAYRDAFGNVEAAPEPGDGQDKAELEHLVDIHLAHEFYHYLEFKSGRFTNEELEPVEVFRLGSLYTKRASVVKTSEIAAHVFCKELLGLPVLPNLLDYVYLIRAGELDSGQLEARLRKWEG